MPVASSDLESVEALLNAARQAQVCMDQANTTDLVIGQKADGTDITYTHTAGEQAACKTDRDDAVNALKGAVAALSL
jgi:hypothetical protein